jgi:hypothetical protein
VRVLMIRGVGLDAVCRVGVGVVVMGCEGWEAGCELCERGQLL